VLRLLGYRGKPQEQPQSVAGPPGATEKLSAPQQQHQRDRPARGALPGAPSRAALPSASLPASGGAPAWDNVWGSG